MSARLIAAVAAGVLLLVGLLVCLWCIGVGWRAARPRLVEPDRTEDGDFWALWAADEAIGGEE